MKNMIKGLKKALQTSQEKQKKPTLVGRFI